jgi:putative peptide zinc metalloprotease protein
MTQQLLSPTWYRVAGLQPRLRSHARVDRHEYRGELWYVLTDRISRRAHRFGPAGHFVVGLMNGRRSLQQIWDAAVARFGDDAPTQDEVIQLLGQLHTAEVLQCDVSPDVDELLRRSHRAERQKRLQKMMSPLAIKFPLLDPDRLLERLLRWYAPLFGRFGALLWLGVIGWAAVTTAQNWKPLTEDLGHRVLAPENLLLIVLVFPLLKAIHEFGHACAVKAWGGEVHEMGVMLLVMMPVPYVDASAATAFPDKRRRVIVGAAGMAVELLVASAALFFWLEMEPGLVRALLFNVMLIAGLSTVLFNANPLLRFDGYYILADLVEIPNLRQRANQYLGALFQQHLFRTPGAVPQTSPGERGWLLFFSVASFCYRITVTLAIAIFVAGQYFVVGVLLGLWAAISGFLMPVFGLLSYLAVSPRLGRQRLRAVLASAAVALVLAILVFVVPVPSWTTAQGVVAVPEQSMVRAGSEGFVTRVVARPGERVRQGDPLVEAMDPVLLTRVRMLEAQKSELEARYQFERSDRLVRAQMTLDQLKSIEAELYRARERLSELVVRSPADGVFALSTAQDLPGRYLKHGDPIGHVVSGATRTARVVVPQHAVDLVRARTRRATLQLAERLGETLPSRILREVPRASDRLPSAALSQAGGGEAVLDPTASGAEPRTLQTYFEFELELPQDRPILLGGRVYVRFDHPGESLGAQTWRWLQQLFLQRLAV